MRRVYITSVDEDFPENTSVGEEGSCWSLELLQSRDVGSVMCPVQQDKMVDLELLLRDYRRVSLGPEAVFVPPISVVGGLYQSILVHKPSLNWLYQKVAQGWGIQFFTSAPATVRFVEEIGLDWIGNTHNPDMFLVQYWSNQQQVRNEAQEAGMECSFIDKQDLPKHHAFSLVFDVKRDRSVFKAGCLRVGGEFGGLQSQQKPKIELIGSGGVVVGTSSFRLGPVMNEDFKEAVDRVLPFVKRVGNSGYRGFLCVEMMYTVEEIMYMTGCIVRGAFPVYAMKLERHLRKRLLDCVVIMKGVVVHERIKSYADARPLIKPMLYRGKDEPGVLMYNTSFLSEGLKKAGLIAIGSSYREAVDLFHKAEKTLQ